MIGRRTRRWRAPEDGGPAAVELTVFRSEWSAGQLAVGVGWDLYRREGEARAYLGPWQVSVHWLRPA